MRSSTGDKIKLAKNWTIGQVENALSQKRPDDLIRFLRDRYEERFFKPIELIMKAKGNEQGYGFSAMALCSLLVETLESYWQGLPSTFKPELEALHCRHIPNEYRVPRTEWKHGKEIFQSFFKRTEGIFGVINGEDFYANIRNGLLHQAQTKGGWTINKYQASTWDSKKKTVHRDRFEKGLKQAFKSYLAQLK
jgi:hypothetical protein